MARHTRVVTGKIHRVDKPLLTIRAAHTMLTLAMDDLTPDVADVLGPAAPEGLFARRQRTKLPALGCDWPKAGEIGLPIPRSRWGDAIAFGARRFSTGQSLKRLHVAKVAAVEPFLQPYVPLIARREFVPMRIEMHPRGLWGASLINLLDDRSHKGVRAQAYSAAGYICEACGSGHGAMEAWELWSYETPEDPVVRGVMRLKRLVCLCKACHEMCRLDRAAKAKRSEDAYKRMQAVNAWSLEEFVSYLDWARRLFAFRSQYHWSLDLSAISHLGRMTLAKAWRAGEEPGEFRATAQEGNVRVHLIGIEPGLTTGDPPKRAVQQDLFVVPTEPELLVSAPYL